MSERTEEFEIESCKGRLDKVLAKTLGISRAEVQRMLAAERIRCDGVVLERRSKLADGARVEVLWPESVSTELVGREMPLEIVHEDEHVRALNKAPGVVVHPGGSTAGDTLVHGLLFLEPELIALDDGSGRPGIVHRLDKDTSGIMITARTEAAQEKLKRSFAKRRTQKFYLALTIDRPRQPSPLEGPIGRHAKHRQKMAVMEDGKPAISHYQLVAASDKGHLWLVRIETGRTHQIRVHFANASAPILGDSTYGRRRVGKLAMRQMLHAWQLIIPHPDGGELLKLKASVPADFRETMIGLNLDPEAIDSITLPADKSDDRG